MAKPVKAAAARRTLQGPQKEAVKKMGLQLASETVAHGADEVIARKGRSAQRGRDASPQELMQEALRKVRQTIRESKEISKDTMNNLVQLLKLHREMGIEDQAPREIRVLWEKIDPEC